MNEIFGFSWAVDSLGYRWIEPEEFVCRASDPVRKPRWQLDEGPYLTKRNVASRRLGDRSYQPLLDYRTLFRSFAYLEPTESAILGFASEFGLLAGDAYLSVAMRDPLHTQQTVEVMAEPFGAWKAEIHALRTLLNLWDSARVGDVSRLRELIQVIGPSDAKVLWTVPEGKILSQAMEQLIAQTVGTKDLESFALEYVRYSINWRLQVLSFPILQPDQGNHRLPLSVHPTGLLGALWLQFARSLDGKDYRRCRQCAKWMEIARGVARSTKQFCDGACRFKWHRDNAHPRNSAKPNGRYSGKRNLRALTAPE
jgi:hypothetical protein